MLRRLAVEVAAEGLGWALDMILAGSAWIRIRLIVLVEEFTIYLRQKEGDRKVIIRKI